MREIGTEGRIESRISRADAELQSKFGRISNVSHTSLTLKSISSWSAVNPLQNECICHLFDGNLGELGAFLQTYGKLCDFQNNPGRKG
jgi:hypothetical protein